MTNSFHLQHCFYLWITCYTCILYLDDCQTTTVLCHEGVLQRNQTCHDKKHEIALHGAAHKNHSNWQSNLNLLNTWATKTIHFNEITPLPLSEITISKFMSIWEYQKPMVCNWNHDFSCQKRKKVMQIMAGNDTGIVPAHEDLCGRGISRERRLIHTTGKQLMRPWPQPCWVTHSTATAEIMLIQALYKIDNTVQFRN